MRPLLTFFARVRLALLALLLGVIAPSAWAQTCGTNETLVTFNFATTPSTNASGGTGTWTTASTGPQSWPVGSVTTATANTLTFQMDLSGAAWQAVPGGPAGNAPVQYQLGNMAGSLVLAMDATAIGGQTGMTITFARPMNKVRFTMADVDKDPTGNGGASDFQDRLQIAGYLSGAAVLPTTTPVGTASYYTTATVGSFAQITRNNDIANCPHGDQTTTNCNVTVDFSAPIDKMRLNFIAGPDVTPPTLQYVGFDNFSFCEPNKPDLQLTKAATTTTFVAGQTGTYTLTITNVGGTPTTGAYTVTDVLSTQGVSFINPQTPAGWTCTLSTTTFSVDTAACTRSTSLAVNGTSVLTLTVSVSADTTATTATNRAKAFGGNDPNKLILTTTGALANCSAANEGLSGGGTNAGCAYEDTTLARQVYLTISKSNGVSTLVAGSTTVYTVTMANLGPSSASGSVFLDPVATGLNCTTVTFTSTPVGSVTVSPSPLTLTALKTTGISMTPTFPPGSTATFNVTCGVTATGQ